VARGQPSGRGANPSYRRLYHAKPQKSPGLAQISAAFTAPFATPFAVLQCFCSAFCSVLQSVVGYGYAVNQEGVSNSDKCRKAGMGIESQQIREGAEQTALSRPLCGILILFCSISTLLRQVAQIKAGKVIDADVAMARLY
jgi:hypothetical protein